LRGSRRSRACRAAIIGASRPEQVAENAAASGLELDGITLGEIEGALPA
jgi:hypothetical protein